MYALTPSGQTRQQLLLQLNNQQRKTWQIDTNRRQTKNSRNEKLFNIEQDLAKTKRQKLQQNIDDTKNDNKNYENGTFQVLSYSMCELYGTVFSVNR